MEPVCTVSTTISARTTVRAPEGFRQVVRQFDRNNLPASHCEAGSNADERSARCVKRDGTRARRSQTAGRRGGVLTRLTCAVSVDARPTGGRLAVEIIVLVV